MPARIEIAEVVSFQLKVPRGALDRLSGELEPDLAVKLRPLGEELLLHLDEGDSYLRFRPVDRDAVLTEIAICNDDQGRFFHRVLGALMTEFEGDLEVRLVWNDSDRNVHGDHCEIHIRRGRSSEPTLSRPAAALRNALLVSTGQPGLEDPFSLEPKPLAALEPSTPDEEQEIEALLARGRNQWAEYQRLKRR